MCKYTEHRICYEKDISKLRPGDTCMAKCLVCGVEIEAVMVKPKDRRVNTKLDKDGIGRFTN